MIRMMYPTDNDLLNFFKYGEFDEALRYTISLVGEHEIIEGMRTEEDMIMSMFGEKLLIMFIDRNDKPLAVANVFPVNLTTVEQYSFYTKNVTPYQFAKYGKIYFEMVKQLPVKRIQATVLTNNEPACLWHERLGFQKEGLLRSYDGKYDYYLYAYLKD